jgi:hypothetical protein
MTVGTSKTPNIVGLGDLENLARRVTRKPTQNSGLGSSVNNLIDIDDVHDMNRVNKT